jgi:hypothetical protein
MIEDAEYLKKTLWRQRASRVQTIQRSNIFVLM